MSEPPPLTGQAADFEQRLARGALLDGARHLARGNHYAAYRRLKQAEAAVDRADARRIRGLIHAAVAGVKLADGDSRGAERQLVRARLRLAEGAPELAAVDVDDVLARVAERVEQGSPHAAKKLPGRL